MRIQLPSLYYKYFQVGFSQSTITSRIDWTVSNLISNDTLNYVNTILYGPDNFSWISDHNSDKIAIARDLKLYWTIGDFGKNRGSGACTEIRSLYLPVSNSDYSAYI